MFYLSLQVLIINFLTAGILTSLLYLFNKSVRHVNPIILFLISSLGSFIGGILAILLPSINSPIWDSVLLSIPGAFLSFVFIIIWCKGVKSESYI